MNKKLYSKFTKENDWTKHTKEDYIKWLENKILHPDPFELGIPNVSFTSIDETDERYAEYKKQRIQNGFDVSETWSLDYTLIKWLRPRLKVFIENYEMVVDEPARLQIFKNIYQACDIVCEDDGWDFDATKSKFVYKQMEELGKMFFGLWW